MPRGNLEVSVSWWVGPRRVARELMDVERRDSAES